MTETRDADLQPGIWVIVTSLLFIVWILGLIFNWQAIGGNTVFISFCVLVIQRKIEDEFIQYKLGIEFYDTCHTFHKAWLRDGNFPLSGDPEKDQALINFCDKME